MRRRSIGVAGAAAVAAAAAPGLPFLGYDAVPRALAYDDCPYWNYHAHQETDRDWYLGIKGNLYSYDPDTPGTQFSASHFYLAHEDDVSIMVEVGWTERDEYLIESPKYFTATNSDEFGFHRYDHFGPTQLDTREDYKLQYKGYSPYYESYLWEVWIHDLEGDPDLLMAHPTLSIARAIAGGEVGRGAPPTTEMRTSVIPGLLLRPWTATPWEYRSWDPDLMDDRNDETDFCDDEGFTFTSYQEFENFRVSGEVR